MSFKYLKKRIATWASNGQVTDFLHLQIFADLRLPINQKILMIDQTNLILTF